MHFSEKVSRISISSEKKYSLLSFYKDGKPLENFPIKWGFTLKKSGTMRFRWNEINENRNSVLQGILKDNNCENKSFVPVELIHSKDVITVTKITDSQNLQVDGIITDNKDFCPVVTVADCMPLYFCDFNKKVFGVVHSGWKGTGIIHNAIEKAVKEFGSKPEDISVVTGPHIHSCCYVVTEERAQWFNREFAPDCGVLFKDGDSLGNKEVEVWKNGEGNLFRLSLEKANLAVLEKCGIKPENVLVCNDCTCCDENFGSNRRETALMEKKNIDFDRGKCFTVQAAFVLNQE